MARMEARTDNPLSFTEQLGQFCRRNASWFLALAFTALLLQDVFGTHGVMAMRHAQKEAATAQSEIDRISQENQQLQNRVESLKNDEQSIEHIAREELGLARPHEFIFETAPRPVETSSPNRSNR
jgi:cell division protein FtsL